MKNQIYQAKSLNVGKIETLTYGKRTLESAIGKKSFQELQSVEVQQRLSLARSS